MPHVGNARTALYNWFFAQRAGGDFLVSIEDTDRDRSEVRCEAQLMEGRRWLGPGIASLHKRVESFVGVRKA
jgi:glutamyl/glutaminyl-tRNA synthetase